jgi:hypothetical protein
LKLLGIDMYISTFIELIATPIAGKRSGIGLVGYVESGVSSAIATDAVLAMPNSEENRFSMALRVALLLNEGVVGKPECWYEPDEEGEYKQSFPDAETAHVFLKKYEETIEMLRVHEASWQDHESVLAKVAPYKVGDVIKYGVFIIIRFA